MFSVLHSRSSVVQVDANWIKGACSKEIGDSSAMELVRGKMLGLEWCRCHIAASGQTADFALIERPGLLVPFFFFEKGLSLFPESIQGPLKRNARGASHSRGNSLSTLL